MLSKLTALVKATSIFTLRDRILCAVLVTAPVMILLVPSLSTFYMQQVQELAITLALSSVSLVLLIMTLLLGTTSIFRDIDRRYVAATLTLPIDRSTYLLAKFVAIIVFLAAATIIMAVGAIIVISLSAAQYPSEIPILWGNILWAVVGDFFKFVLLSQYCPAFILGQHLILPAFFRHPGTIYLSGSASQEVFEFVSGEFGRISALLHSRSSRGHITCCQTSAPSISKYMQSMRCQSRCLQCSCRWYTALFIVEFSSVWRSGLLTGDSSYDRQNFFCSHGVRLLPDCAGLEQSSEGTTDRGKTRVPASSQGSQDSGCRPGALIADFAIR